MDSIRIGRSRHEITFVPGSSGHNFPLWRTGRWASLEQVMRRVSPSTLAVRSAMTAIDLLYEDAASAKEILPAMTKEAYLAYQRGLFRRQRSAYAEE